MRRRTGTYHWVVAAVAVAEGRERTPEGGIHQIQIRGLGTGKIHANVIDQLDVIPKKVSISFCTSNSYQKTSQADSYHPCRRLSSLEKPECGAPTEAACVLQASTEKGRVPGME